MATKLEKIRKYVEDMSPIVRAAVLLSPEKMAENHGYDLAMDKAQRDLLAILDEADYNEHEPLT